jgi:hypothetical protein
VSENPCPNEIIFQKSNPITKFAIFSLNVKNTQSQPKEVSIKSKIFKICKDEKNKINNKIIKENVMEVEEDPLPKIETNMTLIKENESFIEKNITLENEVKEEDDDESDDECDFAFHSKSNSNSLISISKEVFQFLKTKKQIKSSHVTEYILKLLKKSHLNLSFKNIQRRVYDAINVMCAIGILKKEKNQLFFEGGRGIRSEIKKSKKLYRINKLENLMEPIRKSRIQINDRQRDLVVLCSKVLKY